MLRRARPSILLVAVALVVACSDSSAPPASSSSGSSGGAGDGGGGTPDGGPPTSVEDAGVPGADAGDGGVFVPSPGVQTKRELGTTAATFGFYEYLPRGYNDGKPRPLLVFFHGLTENGNGTTDLETVIVNGPSKLIAANAWDAARPWVVLSPQWSGPGCPTADFIQGVIAYGMASYNVDPKQVSLTGISCGAIGGWKYLGKYTSSQVATAILIAGEGAGAFDEKGCELAQSAIWAFHGDADTTVYPTEDQAVMPQLMACPQPRRDQKLTIYPGIGHDSWTQTYDLTSGNDIYAWMLANPKP
jgi:predicted peptidase